MCEFYELFYFQNILLCLGLFLSDSISPWNYDSCHELYKNNLGCFLKFSRFLRAALLKRMLIYFVSVGFKWPNYSFYPFSNLNKYAADYKPQQIGYVGTVDTVSYYNYPMLSKIMSFRGTCSVFNENMQPISTRCKITNLKLQGIQ